MIWAVRSGRVSGHDGMPSRCAAIVGAAPVVLWLAAGIPLRWPFLPHQRQHSGRAEAMLEAGYGALAISVAPSGGPWAKFASRRSSSRRTSARSSSNWSWGENSKQNQAAGTRTEPLSKAMFLKLQYAIAAGC
jgi:hypothetical protein